MSKRKDRKDEAEQAAKWSTHMSSLLSKVGKNPDCDQHKLVETDKTPSTTKWVCASCGMTLTSTVS